MIKIVNTPTQKSALHMGTPIKRYKLCITKCIELKRKINETIIRGIKGSFGLQF